MHGRSTQNSNHRARAQKLSPSGGCLAQNHQKMHRNDKRQIFTFKPNIYVRLPWPSKPIILIKKKAGGRSKVNIWLEGKYLTVAGADFKK